MGNRTEEGSMRGSHAERRGLNRRLVTAIYLRGVFAVALVFPLMLLVLLAGCGSDSDADSDGNPDIHAGQITRPASSGLPLDNPQAVRAYDRADQLLIAWFFRRDIEAALSNFSADVQPTAQPVLEDTNVEGKCFFTQIEGSQPDGSGDVLARYEVRDCQITPPGGSAASHIKISVTIADQNAWVTKVQFE